MNELRRVSAVAVLSAIQDRRRALVIDGKPGPRLAEAIAERKAEAQKEPKRRGRPPGARNRAYLYEEPEPEPPAIVSPPRVNVGELKPETRAWIESYWVKRGTLAR